MVTDVSLNEIRTPPTPTVPLFYHSPSVMNTPENFWTIDFEQELDCNMRALLAEMSSELGSVSAVGDAAGSETASASQEVKAESSAVVASLVSSVSPPADSSIAPPPAAPGTSAQPTEGLSAGVDAAGARRPRERKRRTASAARKPRAKRKKTRDWSSDSNAHDGPTRA